MPLRFAMRRLAGKHQCPRPLRRSGGLALLVALLGVAVAPAGATAAPVVGSDQVQSFVDSSAAGSARAFRYIAPASGSMNELNVYVDGSSVPSSLAVGLYTNANERPKSRLTTLLGELAEGGLERLQGDGGRRDGGREVLARRAGAHRQRQARLPRPPARRLRELLELEHVDDLAADVVPGRLQAQRVLARLDLRRRGGRRGQHAAVDALRPRADGGDGVERVAVLERLQRRERRRGLPRLPRRRPRGRRVLDERGRLRPRLRHELRVRRRGLRHRRQHLAPGRPDGGHGGLPARAGHAARRRRRRA